MKLVRLFQNYLGNCRAASAVEFVLTFPFFILFILVIAEIGLFYFATSAVEQGVHNYSRQLALSVKRDRGITYVYGVRDEIAKFVGPRLIKSFQFEIGHATGDVDLSKPLTRSWVDQKFSVDRNVPLYLRVVVMRPSFFYGIFRRLWRIIGDPQIGGLFSPIDVLIVIPFPLSAQT